MAIEEKNFKRKYNSRLTYYCFNICCGSEPALRKKRKTALPCASLWEVLGQDRVPHREPPHKKKNKWLTMKPPEACDGQVLGN